MIVHRFSSQPTGCSPLLLCVIAMLLFIGCVELNPGPTVAEVSKRLDDFIAKYQAERDKLMASVPSFSTRLDDLRIEITTLVNNMNTAISLLESRLCALEASEFPFEAIPTNEKHDDKHGNQPNIDHNLSTSSIERVVRNVIDKDKRKHNVIIFNMPDSDSFRNDKRNLSKLMYDLDLDENMVESIGRIGQFSAAKPRPLRLQLGYEWCTSMFLDAAYLLKSMKRRWPNLGISPDRSPDDIKIHQNLMKEFRRRRDQGEKIRIVGDKIVPINQQADSKSKTLTQNRSSAPESCTNSPLRVKLPTITSCNLTWSNKMSISEPVSNSSLRVLLPPITSCNTSSVLSAAANIFCPMQPDSNSSCNCQKQTGHLLGGVQCIPNVSGSHDSLSGTNLIQTFSSFNGNLNSSSSNPLNVILGQACATSSA